MYTCMPPPQATGGGEDTLEGGGGGGPVKPGSYIYIYICHIVSLYAIIIHNHTLEHSRYIVHEFDCISLHYIIAFHNSVKVCHTLQGLFVLPGPSGSRTAGRGGPLIEITSDMVQTCQSDVFRFIYFYTTNAIQTVYWSGDRESDPERFLRCNSSDSPPFSASEVFRSNGASELRVKKSDRSGSSTTGRLHASISLQSQLITL